MTQVDEERRKNQLQLASGEAGEGEARTPSPEGTEASMAEKTTWQSRFGLTSLTTRSFALSGMSLDTFHRPATASAKVLPLERSLAATSASSK